MMKNDLEAIDTILKANAPSMSLTDKNLVMNFAMNYSSGENALKVCQILLKHNIRPSSYDLYTAISRNRQNSVIQFMITSGASPNGEILLLAMEKQRFDLAKQFIEAGVDVNYRYALTKQYADGMTPLLYASKWGNYDIVKLLLEKGANINIQAVNGDSAISLARKNNNEKIYNYLIEQGAVEFGNNMPPQSGGIASSQTYNFKIGSYRLSGGNSYLKFSGNANAGNVNYVDGINNKTNNGYYRITGNNISIVMDGSTYVYKIDSNETFSGNGEIWIRSGN
jgi:ankyrin repeat protein